MSPAFQFSLQRVLDYREQCEEQAQLALRRAEQAHEQQQGVVGELEQALHRNDSDMHGLRNPSADELWLYREYKERLLQDLSGARHRLEQLASEMEQRRTELTECSKERRLLEKLKETQYQKFEREHQAREQKTFDETATLRHQDRDL